MTSSHFSSEGSELEPELDQPLLAVLQARNAELEFQLQEYQVRLQQKEEQHSEARLTDIFNRAIASIASLRMSSHQTWEYDYLSSGCEVVFGYSSQAFMTNPTLWISRVLPEDRDAVTTTRNTIFSTGSAAIEYRFCHADGTVRWISETLSSHWDEVAGCGVVTVVSLDVSAHKRTEAEREQRVESESVAYNSIGVSVELAKTISDRRLAEVTLRQSEQRMRSILSSISDAFFSVDREWRFTFLNQQAERVLRRDAQQLLGNTVWESFPDAVGSAFYHQYHWAMEHQQSVSFEAYYPPYDLWVDVRAYPFAAGLTVYFLDITERKQAELEARRLQERLQFLLANTPAAIFTCKPNGDFGATFISDNIQTISGHEPQEFLTESGFWISHLHPDDLNRIIGEMSLLFNEGHHTYEYRFRHKDGSYRWVRDSLRLIRDALGEPVEIVGCVTDISDRKQAEISLRESEQRLQTILESSPLSIFIKDLEGRYTVVNAAYEQMTQLSREQLLGITDYQLLDPDFAEVCWQSDQAALSADEPVVFEEQVPFPDRPRDLLITKFRLCNTAGEPYAICGITVDISDRVQAEREREQQRQRSQLLTGITLKVRQSLDLDNILQTTVDEVQQWLNVDRVIIYRFHPDWSGTVVTEAVKSSSFTILGRTIHEPCFEQNWIAAYQQKQISMISDLAVADIQECYKTFLQQFAVRANLVVPLLQNQHLWGLLITHQCTGPRYWTTDEIELLQQLASQVSIAIQQANLFQQLQLELVERQRAESDLQQLNQELEQRVQQRTQALQQQVEKERLLLAITQRIRESLDLSHILQQAVDGIRQILQVDRVAVYRADVNSSENSIAESVGENWVKLIEIDRLPEWKNLYLREMQRGHDQPNLSFVQDVYLAELTPYSLAFLEQIQARAYAIAPIFSGGMLWGLLAIYQNTAPRDWHPWEAELLQQIATQLAIAIQQSELHQQVQTELAERQQTEARLQEAQRVARVGSWEFDVATKAITWSAEVFVILGLVGQPEPTYEILLQRHFYPEDAARLHQAVTRAIDYGESYEIDFRIICADGSEVWAVGKGQPIFNEQGQVVRLFGTLLDINDRKQAELALQESEERFSKAFRASPVGIAITTFSEGRLIDVNDSYLHLLGYEREAVVGQTTLDLNLWQSKEQRDRVLELLMQQGSVQNLEIQFRTYLGEMRTGIVSLEQIELGDSPCILKLFYDITERKQAEEQLRISLREKEVLLREIHHRVKNNMQLVSSLLRLQMDSITDSATLELFNESQRRVKVMALIHERLYQSSNLGQINFASYIQDLARDIFQSYKSSTAAIELSLDVADIELSIDIAIPAGLIINELVSNALKYAFPKSGTGKISIQFQSATIGHYSLIVKDDGIGIPPEIHPLTTHTLGLQLVYGLVEQLRGTLELDRGAGTQFTMFFHS